MKESTYLSPEDEKAYYERNKESNLRYIRAKLPAANERQLIIIADLIRRMHIVGWSESEYNRKP